MSAIIEKYCHDIPKSERIWKQKYIQILSLDPAKINLALRVEKRYNDGRIEPVIFWKDNFSSNTFVNITKELDNYDDIWRKTHVFIIERQPPRSILMNRIMQHVFSYFLVKTRNYPLLPDVVEVNARIKGDFFGYNKGKDRDLKKWSSILARKMLTERDDKYSLEVMDYWLEKIHPRNQRKCDDLADTVLMIDSYYKIIIMGDKGNIKGKI